MQAVRTLQRVHAAHCTASLLGRRTFSEKAHRVQPVQFERGDEAVQHSKSAKSGPVAWLALGVAVLGIGTGVWQSYTLVNRKPEAANDSNSWTNSAPNSITISNWSGTHSCELEETCFYAPKTVEEVERIVAEAEASAESAPVRLRPTGSSLSPNGLSLCKEGMINLANCDRVLQVDTDRLLVTVEAGITIEALVQALRPYNLTLQNYASIREQQLGGFTQAGAHGTGSSIPPVDEQVVAMELISPTLGRLVLGKDADSREFLANRDQNTASKLQSLDGVSEQELFRFAKVGLGFLGVVTALTLKVVPAHHLLEETSVVPFETVQTNHTSWLEQNQHLRYLWFPGSEEAVVVRSNPVSSSSANPSPEETAKLSRASSLEPFYSLNSALPREDSIPASQLRGILLAQNPLDYEWVRKVNLAEVDYYRRSAGVRVDDSSRILGFDCGDQQWVLEVAFPVQPHGNTTTDLAFMQDLLKGIEDRRISAHSPIEQRWTASSESSMSPVHRMGSGETQVFSWVGIIMYLPPDLSGQEREDVTEQFTGPFTDFMCELIRKYDATVHWAKLEPPRSELQKEVVHESIAAHYPLVRFNYLRSSLDAHQILSNAWLDTLLKE